MLEPFASGGVIHGPRGRDDDRVAFLVADGFVLSAREVEALGYPAAVERLRRALRDGDDDA